MNNQEIWVDVPLEEFKEFYEISSFGNVRSKDRVVTQKNRFGGNNVSHYKSKLLRQSNHKCGYKLCCLKSQIKRQTHYAHRLVALAFISNNDPKNNQVNHINGDKKDNNVSNLEWSNASLNTIHAVSLGLQKSGKNSNRSKPIFQVNPLTNEKLNKFFCIMDVQRELGYSNKNISAVLKNRRKTAYGYKWQYA
jgi:hypothetical protein